jgi:hypothetical protein
MKFRLNFPAALLLASGIVPGASWTAINGGLPGGTAAVIALTVDPLGLAKQ